MVDPVWSAAAPQAGTTPDGSLVVEHRLGLIDWHGAEVHDRWVVISDARTGAVVADCKRWPRSRAMIRIDGSLHLRLSLAIAGSDTLFVIDPRHRSFCDRGLAGPPRPLIEMQAAIDDGLPALRKWIWGDGWETRKRHISPDGTMRVDETIVDNDRGPYLHTVQAYDTATGAALLDLTDTETWAIMRDWTADGSARLMARSLSGFETLDVTLSAAMGTYRLGDGGQVPLRGDIRPALLAKLDAAERLAQRRYVRQPGEFAQRLARVAILIFGLLCGGALVALYNAAFGPMR